MFQTFPNSGLRFTGNLLPNRWRPNSSVTHLRIETLEQKNLSFVGSHVEFQEICRPPLLPAAADRFVAGRVADQEEGAPEGLFGHHATADHLVFAVQNQRTVDASSADCWRVSWLTIIINQLSWFLCIILYCTSENRPEVTAIDEEGSYASDSTSSDDEMEESPSVGDAIATVVSDVIMSSPVDQHKTSFGGSSKLGVSSFADGSQSPPVGSKNASRLSSIVSGGLVGKPARKVTVSLQFLEIIFISSVLFVSYNFE